MYRSWLQEFRRPVHLLIYDDLTQNIERNLREMASFLRIDYTELDMQCTLHNQRGSVYRVKSNITVQSVYSQKSRHMINNAISRILAIIHKRFPRYSNFTLKKLGDVE